MFGRKIQKNIGRRILIYLLGYNLTIGMSAARLSHKRYLDKTSHKALGYTTNRHLSFKLKEMYITYNKMTKTHYDQLLEQAKAAGLESAKTWIPKLCNALKEEDKNLSNEDIRDRVEKDCVEIWSKGTIRIHIPDEFKDPQKQEAGRKGREKQLEQPIPVGGAQENWAENSSFGPTEHDSEDFNKMNRVQDAITQSEKAQKLEKQVSDLKAELNTKNSEIESLRNENKALKEKNQTEMLQEIWERFHDEPGLLKGDKLQKVNQEVGKNLVFMLERYNSVLQDVVEQGQPVPIGLYIISKPEMVFIPVRFHIDFDKRKLQLSLWEKKLT